MLEILKAKEENYTGSYIINTADAYRGCAAFVSGISGSSWYVNLPTNSAQLQLVRGIVTKFPLIETGSDTADATDKLVKGSKVVFLQGECEIKVSGGAVEPTTWVDQYWFGKNLATAVQSIATAFWRNAYISTKTGSKGRWVATGNYTWQGWGKVSVSTPSNASKVLGPRCKVVEVTGGTAQGVYVRIDVDWNRQNYALAGGLEATQL